MLAPVNGPATLTQLEAGNLRREIVYIQPLDAGSVWSAALPVASQTRHQSAAIRLSGSPAPSVPSAGPQPSPFSIFTRVTQTEVEGLIKKMKPSTSPLDPFPTALIKSNMTAITLSAPSTASASASSSPSSLALSNCLEEISLPLSHPSVISGLKAQTASISHAQNFAPWETEPFALLPLASGTPSLNICENPTLTERIEGIETRITEAEGRISSAEDSVAVSEGQLANLLTKVEQLQSKVDDLENRGRRKNLRIVVLPEGAEGSGPLTLFLRSSIPKWLDLPADSLALDIERAHRSPTFVPNNLNSSPRSVLIRLLRFTEKETVLRAALKKTINHEGAELRFYSDLSTSVLQKRREFSSVVKTMASRGLNRGFAYPARLRCLHMGKIRLFDDPNSSKAFLDSLDRPAVM
ncbi:unnamed protein product [Leuciscus chuanchicus]